MTTSNENKSIDSKSKIMTTSNKNKTGRRYLSTKRLSKNNKRRKRMIKTNNKLKMETPAAHKKGAAFKKGKMQSGFASSPSSIQRSLSLNLTRVKPSQSNPPNPPVEILATTAVQSHSFQMPPSFTFPTMNDAMQLQKRQAEGAFRQPAPQNICAPSNVLRVSSSSNKILKIPAGTLLPVPDQYGQPVKTTSLIKNTPIDAEIQNQNPSFDDDQMNNDNRYDDDTSDIADTGDADDTGDAGNNGNGQPFEFEDPSNSPGTLHEPQASSPFHASEADEEWHSCCRKLYKLTEDTSQKVTTLINRVRGLEEIIQNRRLGEVGENVILEANVLPQFPLSTVDEFNRFNIELGTNDIMRRQFKNSSKHSEEKKLTKL